MSTEEIEIHFEQMKALSAELSEVAQIIWRLAENEMPGEILGIKAGWISENTNLFKKKGKKTADRILGTAQELKEISDDILKKAEQIYRTEQWNCLTARARSYR